MDRRQKKSRQSIFLAFSSLLKEKNYSSITVNDIIEQANVCRSTFYSHFETKDFLLKDLCAEVFEHIFSNEICKFAPFENSLEGKLAHVLTHVQTSEYQIAGILASVNGEIMLTHLKEYLKRLFEMHLGEFKVSVPQDFFINHLTGSFAEAITWWVKNQMEIPPEKIASIYLSLIEKH